MSLRVSTLLRAVGLVAVLGGTGLVMTELSGSAADGGQPATAARIEPSPQGASVQAPSKPAQSQSAVRVVYEGPAVTRTASLGAPAPAFREPQRPEPAPAAPAKPMPPQATAPIQVNPPPTPSPQAAPVAASAAIDLNTASLEQLNGLPGAGMIGRAIIKGRPYASTDDLVAKRILNRATFARIKDQVAVR